MTDLERLAEVIRHTAVITFDGGLSNPEDCARAILTELLEPTESLSEFMSVQAANGMVDWRDLHRTMIDHILEGK